MLGLDIELQAFGIHAVSVVPGGYATKLAANRASESGHRARSGRDEAHVGDRVGTPKCRPSTPVWTGSNGAEPRARSVALEVRDEGLAGLRALRRRAAAGLRRGQRGYIFRRPWHGTSPRSCLANLSCPAL